MRLAGVAGSRSPHRHERALRKRLAWTSAARASSRAMAISIQHVTIDCPDPYELARFWHEVTGWPLADDDFPGDPEASLVAPAGKTGLWFQHVPKAKTLKNRLHLDIVPDDHTREEEMERLLGLGATLVADHRRPDGGGWVVLADPDGNEFCVLRQGFGRDRSAD